MEKSKGENDKRSLRELTTQEIFSREPTLEGLRELTYRAAYERAYEKAYEEAYAKQLSQLRKEKPEKIRHEKAEVEPPKPELLTVQELANRLRVPVSWVYARTREKGLGAMPVTRIGKYRRFELPKVLEWLASKQKDE